MLRIGKLPLYLRHICTQPPIPSEAAILRLLRQGNYEAAIRKFVRVPVLSRSNLLHESLIQACAQVPDAASANAVLDAMPTPTLSAASHVITALCRERNVHAAVHLVERLPSLGITADDRLLAGVMRAARSDQAILSRLKRLPRTNVAKSPHLLPRGSVKEVAKAEAQLNMASRNVNDVQKIWSNISEDRNLQGDVGILAAAVSAFISSGSKGGPRAINAVMTWIRSNLYDHISTHGKQIYTSSPSAMALLLTSTTKALAASARSAPSLSLSAYDVLQSMQLPGFASSLPLTGAYFKVLQHANLSLDATKRRIELARAEHIQLDEQAFSMALGAILRCDARVVDKLTEGRAWTDVMRSAAIPLTVHTYNLFAGQLRYCNNPQLVTSLLSDMAEAGVVPTSVTYGLIFSACVIPGEYSSFSRKQALPVSIWEHMLDSMLEHMQACGVSHTPNSRLSLARAYAHFGQTSNALREFDAYLHQARLTRKDTFVGHGYLEDAFSQMMYNFAHCRECSMDGPNGTLLIFERMQKEGLSPSSQVLNALLVACVRMGYGEKAVNFAVEFSKLQEMDLSEVGLKHLLKAHAEMRVDESWYDTRALIMKNRDLLESPELRQSVHELVVSFARRTRQDLCDDVMEITGMEVSDLDYILRGREFLRFRKRRRGLVPTEEGQETLSHDRKTAAAMGRSNENSRLGGTETRSRSFHDGSVLPSI